MMTTLRVLKIVCVLAFVAAASTTAFGWDEDFESYAAGENLTEGTNPNGWTALVAGESLQMDVGGQPWAGGPFRSDDPPGLPLVADFDGADKRMAANGWAAAKADIPTPTGDVYTLEYTFTGSDAGRTSLGIELRDSVNGGAVQVHTDYGGWILDTNPAPDSCTVGALDCTGILGKGDYGVYTLATPQRVSLTFDYANDNVHLTSSAADGVTPIYNGANHVVRSTDPALDPDGSGTFAGGIAIPASFAPDTIVVFGGVWGGNSDLDNITYTPEPGSLLLLGLGGMLFMFRRWR